jgi:hypothetical protein
MLDFSLCNGNQSARLIIFGLGSLLIHSSIRFGGLMHSGGEASVEDPLIMRPDFMRDC